MRVHLNPLSPNSDQHQFSPNNMNALSREEGVRIKEKFFDLLSNSFNQFFKEKDGDQSENLYVNIGA